MSGTTFSETFTSSASTTGQTNTVMTADPGKGFDVDRVGIAIESGAGSDVTVQVFAGDQPVVPQDDAFDVAGEFVWLGVDHELSPSGTLDARHDNNSSTARDVTVIVEGDEHGKRGGGHR